MTLLRTIVKSVFPSFKFCRGMPLYACPQACNSWRMNSRIQVLTNLWIVTVVEKLCRAQNFERDSTSIGAPKLTQWCHDWREWSFSKTDSNYFHSTCFPIFHFEVLVSVRSYIAIATTENRCLQASCDYQLPQKAIIILWRGFCCRSLTELACQHIVCFWRLLLASAGPHLSPGWLLLALISVLAGFRWSLLLFDEGILLIVFFLAGDCIMNSFNFIYR